MSRTISQIYSEAINVRNNYLQLTELDSGRTKSKMSVLNLMTYVMSVLIHSYEVILDVFQVNIAKLIASRINGTPEYYATMAKKFQFNSATGNGDQFHFNEETMQLEYDEVNASHQIVVQSAWQNDTTSELLILKVSKQNPNAEQVGNGMLYAPLSDNELSALRTYIRAIKFVGSKIFCISIPGDLITIRCGQDAHIYYNNTYTTEERVLEEIKSSLLNYAKSVSYNSFIYYQSFIDAIQSVKYVVSIDAGIVIEARAYNMTTMSYEAPARIIGQYRPQSGYIGYLDEHGESTINVSNIVLTPISEL